MKRKTGFMAALFLVLGIAATSFAQSLFRLPAFVDIVKLNHSALKMQRFDRD